MSLVLDQVLVQNSNHYYNLYCLFCHCYLSGKNFPWNCGLYLFLYSKVKTLGAADSDDDDSAASWVAKSRKKENEKSLAEKRVSYHLSSYNLEKALNFSSRLEKSLNSVNLFIFGGAKHSGSDRECKYFPFSYPLSDLGSACDWSCRLGNLLQPIRSTTQIWGVTRRESAWNFCAHFLDVISQGKQWWHHKMPAVFPGYSKYGNPL